MKIGIRLSTRRRHPSQSIAMISCKLVLLAGVLASWRHPSISTCAFAPSFRKMSGPERSCSLKNHREKTHRQQLSCSTTVKDYDIIIVGGGSAGLTAAKFAKTFQKSVAIIESSKLGGDCTWTGCVPSKTLLAEAKHIWNWKKINEKYGVDIVDSSLNEKIINDVKKQIDENREQIYKADDSPEVLKSLGIDTISGKAFLLDKRKVEVSLNDSGEKCELNAKFGILLATGATPKNLAKKIHGIDSVPYWTYENVWDRFFDASKEKRENRRVIVVGGGPIGVELSQALFRLGSSVTIVARSPRLLPMAEEEASLELQLALEEEGLNILCGNSVVSVCQIESTGGKKSISVTLDSNEVIQGDHILVATGRAPNTRNMGLEAIGVQIDSKSGGIRVNRHLETSIKGIFAAGDCTGDRQFTHYAGFQGAIAARNILLPLKDPGVLDEVPSTVFTDPEVASLGLTEDAARRRYGNNNVSVASRKLFSVDRSVCEQTQKFGFIKIVYHLKTNQILGATIMAPAAGELISELNVAKENDISLDKIAKVTHSYPSYSIALQQMAAEIYYEKLKKWTLVYSILKWIGL